MAAIPAGASLWLAYSKEIAPFAIITYSVGLFLLFAVSAFYHVPMWKPATRTHLRRADRSMIYIFIAGTYTPILVLLDDNIWGGTIWIVWAAALIGVAISLFFTKLPRWVTATPYVVLGWGACILMPAVWSIFDHTVFWLIATGGLMYTVGAVSYASKKPDPWPRTFGSHEIFHLFVIGAAVMHYLAIRLALGW